MNTKELARAARRVLEDRLGRLRGSMQDLGAWFRENVAQLIGKHAGDAVHDALAAALGRGGGGPRDDERRDRYGGYGGGQTATGGYGGYDPYALPEEEQWGDGDDAGLLWQGREAAKPRHEPARPRSRRWDGVLAAVAQVGCWWLRMGLPRASFVRVIALSAAAGLAAILVSPIVGGLIATAGTAILAAAPPPEQPTNRQNRPLSD